MTRSRSRRRTAAPIEDAGGILREVSMWPLLSSGHALWCHKWNCTEQFLSSKGREWSKSFYRPVVWRHGDKLDIKIKPHNEHIFSHTGSSVFCSLPSSILPVCVSLFITPYFESENLNPVWLTGSPFYMEHCVSSYAFLAFLRHFRFWMDIVKVAKWIRLEILNPKHMRESKIGLLEQIWASKRRQTFFWGTLSVDMYVVG